MEGRMNVPTYKGNLKKLTKAVAFFLAQMDRVMTQPTSEERGNMVAKLCNYLDRENDAAMHFGLDYGFRKIKNLKEKLNHVPNDTP
jgi:hypothetical protein